MKMDQSPLSCMPFEEETPVLPYLQHMAFILVISSFFKLCFKNGNVQTEMLYPLFG